MTEDENIKLHLEICKAMYLRMLADGSWPWRDSQDSVDVVDSRDTNEDV